MSQYQLMNVKHDPSHCLAPGLFRSLGPGERKKSKLDLKYDFGEGRKIEISGPEPLGADDMRVLQGLLAMAGLYGKSISKEENVAETWLLREGIELKWDAVRSDLIVVRGSYSALMREIGYKNSNNVKPIQDSIERIWKVSVIVQQDRKRLGFHLLSSYASDESKGALCVALNPLLTKALAGSRYVYLNMNEVRALRSDPARLIHQRLCAWIDIGKSGKVSLDTLCGYIWPDEGTSEAMKKRRQTTKKALMELESIGWKVNEYADKKWAISRPSSKKNQP